MMLSRLAAITLVFAWVSGCSDLGSPHRPDPDKSVIFSDDGLYLSGRAVEMPDGWTYFLSLSKSNSDGPARLQRVRPGSRAEVIQIAGSTCDTPGLSLLRLLPGNQLGALENCRPDRHSVVAIDLQNKRANGVVEVGPHEDASMSDMPSLSGWFYNTTDDCLSIAPFVGGKRQAAPSSGIAALIGRPLDAAYGQSAGTSCGSGSGQIRSPRTLPDGWLLALVQGSAAAASGGAATPQRESRLWDIYFLNAAQISDRKVAGGFANPMDVISTRDGSKVFVAGLYKGAAGIWLVDVETGSISSAAPGKFFGISLSIDETAIVATEEGNSPNLIRRFPVT